MEALNLTRNTIDHWHMTFSWYDYTFFSIMLGLSALVGIYFGFIENKQTSANEYLLGGKQMKVIPIALSLTASNISGITLLAVPTDVYRFGATYWLYCTHVFLVYLITYYVYLPVFYKLQLTSTYEYLKLRFNGKIRVLASFLYTIYNMLYLTVVIYIPALAFSQATGVNLHLVTPIVCGVCIFYTTIGGLKAVVWTDTLQFIVMVGSIIAVFYMGILSVGGWGEMWRKNIKGKRLEMDMDLDPTKRDTAIATTIGTLFGSLSYVPIGQGFVQKYLSMPKIEDVKKALLLFSFGVTTITSFSVVTGLIMYAKYADCDPFTAGKILRQDEVLPYYVMDVSRTIPGLAGLFISGIFSAALSTLSATMNSLSGSIYEDFISSFMPKNITQKTVSNILKLIVIIIGILSTGLVFLIEKMGSILPIQISLGGISAGPLLGIFSLGIIFPIANSKGALFGGLGALAIMTIIVTGSQIHKAQGHIYYEPKPLSIDGCNVTYNVTYSPVSNTTRLQNVGYDVFYPFKITHYYYPFIGTILVFLIGLPISWLTTKKGDPIVNRDLISPISQWMIKGEKEKGEYLDVNEALYKVNQETK